MVELLRPSRGGFLRPFGCGWFIREFLLGNGPNGSPKIDPLVGAPPAEMFHHYKLSLMHSMAFSRAISLEEKRAKKEKRFIDPNNITELADQFLARMPYKAQGCRFHSFIVYFSIYRGWAGWNLPAGKSRQLFRSTTQQDNHTSIFASQEQVLVPETKPG